VVGLIGPNGSGKSTVLRCVYRMQRPAAGMIRLDNPTCGASPHRIERGGRLVGEDQLRLAGQRHGDPARCRIPPDSSCG